MPVLKNARRELFSQLVAQGKVLGEAYVLAGFKPNTGNPSTLKSRKKEVESRIKEILNKRNRKVLEKKGARGRDNARINIGRTRGSAADCEASTQWMCDGDVRLGKAKVQGLIIDRREIGEAGTFDSKTDEELVAQAKKRRSASDCQFPASTRLSHFLPEV